MKNKEQKAPNLFQLERQYIKAIHAIFAPTLRVMVAVTLRQFEDTIKEAVEIEMAKRNCEYAQALIDNAQ